MEKSRYISGRCGRGFVRWRFPCALLLLLPACGLLAASLRLPVHEERLRNGLTLLVLPRHHVPQIACQITYCVGSAYEKPGLTGISHFLEHMMFKGTERIGVVDPKKDVLLRKELDATAERIRLLTGRASSEGTGGEETSPPEGGSGTASGRVGGARLKELKRRMAELRRAQDANIVSEELWKIYQRAGGTELNAETACDYTRYYVKLPSGREELFFYLESDRMENAVFRQFYPERDVVLAERSERVEGRPTGRFHERLQGIFFEAHPYRYPVIGYPQDVRRITREKLRAYFRKYYRPNNAILTLVGDITPERAHALAEKYFGWITPGPEVPRPEVYHLEDLGEKRLEVEANAPSQVMILYHTPPEGHPDSFALDCAAEVLNGTAGRLNIRCVQQEKLAVRVAAWNWTRKLAGEFGVMAFAAPGADLRRLQEVLLQEVEGLAKRPPTEEELKRSRLHSEASFVHELEGLMGSAALLSRFQVIRTWRDIQTYLERLERVTPAGVVSVAKKYLGPVRTVGVLKRKERRARRSISSPAR